MRSFALLIGCFSFACGSSTSRSPTPPAHPQPVAVESAPRPGPELVEVPARETPTDCVAEGPEGGLLDRTSTHFRRIEYSANPQLIEEKAFLVGSDVVVTATVGGCAHFGASYTVDMPSTEPVANLKLHLESALKVLMQLPLREGSSNFRDEIHSEILGARDDAARLSTCHFPRGEIDSVMCGVSSESAGRVVVSLAYDIAL